MNISRTYPYAKIIPGALLRLKPWYTNSSYIYNLFSFSTKFESDLPFTERDMIRSFPMMFLGIELQAKLISDKGLSVENEVTWFLCCDKLVISRIRYCDLDAFFLHMHQGFQGFPVRGQHE